MRIRYRCDLRGTCCSTPYSSLDNRLIRLSNTAYERWPRHWIHTTRPNNSYFDNHLAPTPFLHLSI